MAASSVASTRSARSASAGSCTTTVAVVPMARNERVVRSGSGRRGLRHEEVPPDVTVGEEVLAVGAEDEDEAPVFPELEVVPDPLVEVEVEADPEDEDERGSCRDWRRVGARPIVSHHDPDGHGGAGGREHHSPREGAQPRPDSVPLCGVSLCGRARLAWN